MGEKSKPYKDVSNQTKTYQEPNFEFYFKNLDCFNKHFDVSTLCLFPNIFSMWSTPDGLFFLYINLFALSSAPSRSYIVSFGQRFYNIKILNELNHTDDSYHNILWWICHRKFYQFSTIQNFDLQIATLCCWQYSWPKVATLILNEKLDFKCVKWMP